MATDLSRSLAELRAMSAELVNLGRVIELLGWDQETMMPPGGAPYRGAQLATLEGIAHERLTSARVGDLLARAEDALASGVELPQVDRALVRDMRHDYNRAVKLPGSLVREMARATSEAVEVWRQARERNDWTHYAPILRRLIDLKRQEAQHVGYDDEPYDALLDTYEPGLTTAQLMPLFTDLRRDTVELLDQIKRRPQVDATLAEQEYDADRQLAFSRRILELVRFDLSSGRLDVSTHPFATTVGPGDVRLTTRRTSRGLEVFSAIHEAGHGLYEQGLDPALADSMVGQSSSLGVHESQSRLWENFIGRGLPFWEFIFPTFAEFFPEQAKGASPETIVRAVNRVEPSLIRIEADEVTYNLHIIIRFEIERRLFAGDLQVDDLPRAWNELMRDYLGIVPPTNSQGVLQDIHWAIGLIGYFPTYSLGNIYAAQLWATLQRDYPDLDERLARGEFGVVLDWLRERIHRKGKLYPPVELIERATGEPIEPRYLGRYLNEKYGAVYGFSE